MVKKIILDIAGIALGFEQEGSFPSFDLSPTHIKFVRGSDVPAPRFETILHSHYSPILKSIHKGPCLFESGGLWKLYENEKSYIIELTSSPESNIPYKILDIQRDFMMGTLYCGNIGESIFPAITEYPIDEVLMVNILSLGIGIEIHACAVSDSGRGFLYLGASGAGKSTIAESWKQEKGVLILSDDRIIIRKINGRFYAYGTPWHGDAEACESGRVPIEKILFLNQAEHNRTKPLNRIDAASRLFVCCFPTFWDKDGMAFTLSFIDEIIKEIPSLEFSFIQDRSVIDFTRELE